MKNLTIGKKIALGFGALIMIAGLLGGLAVVTMKSVQTLSHKLSTEYVPESQIAGDLEGAMASMQLAIRSYGLTADSAYLEPARKGLAEAHKQQQLAQKLADEHPDLLKLREELQVLEPALKSYESLISQTEAKNANIVEEREKMNKNAADFVANIDKLIATQKTKLEGEMKAALEAGKLQQRLNKLTLATDIRVAGNLARIAVFKSQALRDPKLIEAGLKYFEDQDKDFAELMAMLTVAEDIAELKQVQTDAHNYRDAMKEIMADSVLLTELSKKRVEVAAQLATLVDEIQQTGVKRTVEAATASTDKLTAASWVMMIGLGVALVVGIAIAFFIIRGINKVLTSVAKSLDENSNQVAAAAGQVSASSQSLAEGSSEQAASLEETSASLEEVSSMTRRNALNAQSSKEFTGKTRQTAEIGVASTKEMGVVMQGIRTASAELSEAMSGIKAASNDVSKIIKTIDEIAFQTNILALNAAVEAARAGEAGMGFAVVADEVRNLAQRSAKAARETTDMIETSIQRSEAGVRVTEKVTTSVEEVAAKSQLLAQNLAEILNHAQKTDEQVGQIASASAEQTEGISQVSIAVSQMDKVTQSNAATAEESAAAAEELNAQAEMLKDVVRDLQKLVGGGQSQKGAPQPASAPKATNGAKGFTSNVGKQNGHAMSAGKSRSITPAKSGKPEPVSATHADFKDF